MKTNTLAVMPLILSAMLLVAAPQAEARIVYAKPVGSPSTFGGNKEDIVRALEDASAKLAANPRLTKGQLVAVQKFSYLNQKYTHMFGSMAAAKTSTVHFAPFNGPGYDYVVTGALLARDNSPAVAKSNHSILKLRMSGRGKVLWEESYIIRH